MMDVHPHPYRLLLAEQGFLRPVSPIILAVELLLGNWTTGKLLTDFLFCKRKDLYGFGTTYTNRLSNQPINWTGMSRISILVSKRDKYFSFLYLGACFSKLFTSSAFFPNPVPSKYAENCTSRFAFVSIISKGWHGKMLRIQNARTSKHCLEFGTVVSILNQRPQPFLKSFKLKTSVLSARQRSSTWNGDVTLKQSENGQNFESIMARFPIFTVKMFGSALRAPRDDNPVCPPTSRLIPFFYNSAVLVLLMHLSVLSTAVPFPIVPFLVVLTLLWGTMVARGTYF